MNVLSLFSGIETALYCLDKSNIKVDNYYSCEIDKYAISVSRYHYKDRVNYLGDVTKVDWNQLVGKVDFILGGSPCTNLSCAGDCTGLKGAASKLFYSFMDAINIIKPKYFLLENVASMKQEWKNEISHHLNCQPVMINSALLGAQTRKRYYWCNWEVQQPEDKHIYLKDILEGGIPLKDKAYCISAKDRAAFEHDYPRCQNNFVAIQQLPHGNNPGYIKADGKVPAMTTANWQTNNKVIVGCALRTRERNGLPRTKRLEVRKDDKANSMTTVTSDSMVCMDTTERIGNLNGSSGQGNRVYSVRGKSVCLSANGGGGGAKTGLYKIDLPDGDYVIRKLTPIECERLMNLPDGYTSKGIDINGKEVAISNSQRYKQLGNGWDAAVITHILDSNKELERK